MVDVLLTLGADAQARNALGWTALHYACYSGASTEVVERLLRHRRGVVAAGGVDVDARTQVRGCMCVYMGPNQ